MQHALNNKSRVKQRINQRSRSIEDSMKKSEVRRREI